MTKILRFPCDLARTMRNTLREFLIVIATVAKVSCKHGLWLVVRVNEKGCQSDSFSHLPSSVFHLCLELNNLHLKVIILFFHLCKLFLSILKFDLG